jgi:hypothetical protein
VLGDVPDDEREMVHAHGTGGEELRVGRLASGRLDHSLSVFSIERN